LALLTALIVTAGVADRSLASQSASVKKEHVVAQALADRAALNPGETAQLAVMLKMDPAWHVYWRNAGDTGSPTNIEWSGPAGFKFGRVQFPVPVVHTDKIVGDTYIHEGTSYFLVDVVVPENAPVGKTVELTAKVDWLVCKEACILGDAELTLKMPIAAKGAAVKPANADALKKARSALPLPLNAKTPYVKLTWGLAPSPVKPGIKTVADLAIAIDNGHHLQSNRPKGEGMIATRVFVDPPEGFQLEEIEYPKGIDRKVAGETVNEYTGTVHIKIPLAVDPDSDKSPRFIRGILRYQACNEKGTCFPPENVAFAIPVQMEGGAAPGSPDETFTPKVQRADAGPVSDVQTDATASSAGTPTATPTTFQARVEAWFAGFGNIGIVFLAFIGGMLLNLMPCVLPVISLKVLSFVRQAHEDRWRIFELGMSYSAGILTFFAFLTFMFLFFQKGWGQLFQSPTIVIILAGVVFALALSLFGVFTIFTPRVVSELATKAEGESLGSAFGTGVLATLLGTACSGPGLGAALGAASKMTPVWGGSVFMAVGFGMAMPFMLLAAQPAWVRFVPKPGKWMKTFEEVMGFLLLCTVVWLVNPLRNQIGGWGMMMTLLLFVGIAIACTIKGRIGWGDSPARKARLYIGATGVLALSWLIAFGGVLAPFMPSIHTMVEEQSERVLLQADGERYRQIKLKLDALAANGDLDGADLQDLLDNSNYDLKWDKGIPWQHFDGERIRKAVERGYTVFVDYTADWCASCKTNKNTSIDVEETRRVMKELGVIPFEADYTLKDPRITKDLEAYKRPGVPMYLVYKPNQPDKPELLPELLTPSLVIDALRRAGPSKVAARSNEADDVTLAVPPVTARAGH